MENNPLENEQPADDIQKMMDEAIKNAESETPAVEQSAEERLKAELATEKDKYLRLVAEFDNYKKRTSRERLELIQTAGKEVIAAMLPVLDDFERALKQMETAQDVAAVKEGVQLVYNKLKAELEIRGLKSMEAVNQEFDADKHEAITEIPAPAEDLKGKVVDEVQKGYLLFDKIIRFAKVVVGK